MFVMFHQLGKNVQDFWPRWSLGYLGYDMSRTHSIMRIATTASPVSGAEVRDRSLILARQTKMKGALAIISRLVTAARERDYIKWLIETKGTRDQRARFNKRPKDIPSPLRNPIPSPLRPASPVVSRMPTNETTAAAQPLRAVAQYALGKQGPRAATNGNGSHAAEYGKISKLDPLDDFIKPLNGSLDASMEMPPLTVSGKSTTTSTRISLLPVH